MFERLGSWTYRFKFLIVLGWILLVGFMAFAPSLAGSGSSDQTTFLPSGAPSVAARQAIEAAFPGSTSTSSATITLLRPGGLTDADLQFRDDFAAWTQSDQAPAQLRAAVTGTETADSRPELETLLRNDDGSFEMLVINLNVADTGDAAASVVGQLRDHLKTAPAGLETHVTGAAAISSDYLDAVRKGTESTTAITIALVIVVLLLIYRAPLAALVPLATIGAAYMVARGILGWLATMGWQVSSTLDTFLVVLVFGVGTDYAIFLISRYREEVSGGGDWHDAARTTVKRIGAVITASAGTVIVGMMAMGFADFKMLTYLGPSLGLAVGITLVAAMTLAPALMSIFGHYLFWPLHVRARHDAEAHGFFASLASVVSRHPGVVTVGILALLLVPALYMPQVESNFDVLADLPASADSRKGYEAISAELGSDKLVQSTAIVTTQGADVRTPANLAKLHALMVQLHQSGGIATTTSILTPDGDTTVPDGFLPSKTLADMADELRGQDTSSGDTSAILGADVRDGLSSALDYVNGLAIAFPDVGARSEMRAVQGTFADALDTIDNVQRESVLSTQLRTLSESITSPAAVASAGTTSADSMVMVNYLDELGTAYPEVRSLDSYWNAVAAARDLSNGASVDSAIALAGGLDQLAQHFDNRPDATFVPKSLSNTPSAKQAADAARQTFTKLPNQVAALAQVFASRLDDMWIPTTLTGDDAAKVQDAIDAFVSSDGSATRFYVTSSSDPYSGDAFAVIKDTRVLLDDAAPAFGSGANAYIGGPTAQFTDVQDTLARDFQMVGVITIIGVLLVLVLLLRAIVAPLYLVATVLVSYASTVGIAGFVFQDVLGQPGISPYLPLIVFVLLVALGSDYNIFLMHRVREEAENRPIREGVRVASGRTGAVITSAGLVLAGTFGSMMVAPVGILVQVGFAVAVGVLIDTFLVRSILVPAITSFVGDRAWWPAGASFAGLLGRAPQVPGAAAAAGAGVARGVASAMRPRSRSRLAVSLALAVLVPVAVAAILTWSFGTAADNLSSIKAATVNLDQGGSVPLGDGSVQPLVLGDDLVTALTTSHSGFTWVATDAKSATDGLANGEYAAVVTIPADFSRSVAAIRTDPTGNTPQATLNVATSDGSSATLGSVARAITEAIGTTTARGITASYIDDVLVRVTNAREALSSGASDAASLAGDSTSIADNAAGVGTVAESVTTGLRQLADATSSAGEGSSQLVDGMNQLADGTDALASGTRDIADGQGKASDGAGQLARGAAQLSDGLHTLKTETAALPGQVSRLADGADGVSTGASGVAAGAKKLADGLDQMADETTGMGDGAVQLDTGAAALAQGARDLRDGAKATASGASDLADGASKLSNGVDQYTGAVDALAANCELLAGPGAPVCAQLAQIAAGSADLRSGAHGVDNGATQLDTGVSKLADGMDGIVDGADGVQGGTAKLAQNLPELETGISQSASGADDLATGSARLATGAEDLASGTGKLSDGMPALTGAIVQAADGAGSLSDGMDTYATGMKRLADGGDTLASGARQTADGARTLADGASSSADGMGQLTAGIEQAADGASLVEVQVGNLADDGSSLADRANTLSSGLDESASGLGTYDAQTRTKVGGLAAQPVAVDQNLSQVSARDSFAPYFMSLAAWLAVLGALLVLPALRRRKDQRYWLAFLRSFVGIGLVALVGSLLMVGVLTLVAGVSIANAGILVVFLILAVVAFAALTQALVALFGMRGWFLALLLLVLGIAASGIGFDAAAVPGPLAAIRPLVPLTYAIDAFRGAVLGTAASFGADAVALGLFLVASVVVTLATAAASNRAAEPAEPLEV